MSELTRLVWPMFWRGIDEDVIADILEIEVADVGDAPVPPLGVQMLTWRIVRDDPRTTTPLPVRGGLVTRSKAEAWLKTAKLPGSRSDYRIEQVPA